jgi:hypothetical protein
VSMLDWTVTGRNNSLWPIARVSTTQTRLALKYDTVALSSDAQASRAPLHFGTFRMVAGERTATGPTPTLAFTFAPEGKNNELTAARREKEGGEKGNVRRRGQPKNR